MYIKLSLDAERRSDDMFAEVLGGISIAQRPERYVELNKAKNKCNNANKNLNYYSSTITKPMLKKS